MVALDNGVTVCHHDPMKSMKFSLPDDLREAIKVVAEMKDRSEASVIRVALRRDPDVAKAYGIVAIAPRKEK